MPDLQGARDTSRTTSLRRWGFRARLTASIAFIFVGGSAMLLVVQFLLTQQLFRSAAEPFEVVCTSDASHTNITVRGGTDEIVCDQLTADGEAPKDTLNTIQGAHESQISANESIAHEVLSGLLLWSAVLFVVFATCAILAAWWLSGRAVRRIARITGITNSIGAHALHQRLTVGGPSDEITDLGIAIDGMLGRIEEAYTRQKQFIANASHELRTPIASARTALEIPIAQGRVPEALMPAVQRALSATQHSERTIEALLTLTRVSTEHDNHGPEMIDAQQTGPSIERKLQESIERHQSLAADRGTFLEQHLLKRDEPLAEGGAELTEGAETLLRLVLDNLIENAIVHSEFGGTVKTATSHDDEGLTITIENSGRILNRDDIEQFSAPFHRGESTRQFTSPRNKAQRPGLGMGLPIALAACERLGVEIRLSPRKSGGLRILLLVPYTQGANFSR